MAKTANKDSLLLMWKDHSIKSVLNPLEPWIKISVYPYRDDNQTSNGNNKYSYVIQHDMGLKYQDKFRNHKYVIQSQCLYSGSVPDQGSMFRSVPESAGMVLGLSG